MPLVSVLLPVRDAAATLGPALRSLLEQTWADWELIAVDDGSTDASRVILEAAAGRDRRVRVLAGPQAGIVSALQRGLAASSAPWVARADADDVCHRRRLELQVRRAAASPRVDALATRVHALGPTGEGMRRYIDWQNGLTSHEAITRSLFIESPLAHPTLLLRREALEAAGGYLDPGWAEDFDLWHRLREAGARFEKLPERLVAWRDAPGRLSRTHAMYAPRAFHRARVHYLLRHPLGQGAFRIWGAGPIGRAWARDLLAAGREVTCAVDIDPRKVGRTIASGRVPVLSVEDGLAAGEGLILGAVGALGAREVIRLQLEGVGLEEGREFLFVA